MSDATATVMPTPAQILAERGTPPIGSVWKYSNNEPTGQEWFSHERVEAFLEVQRESAYRHGIRLEVFLHCDAHHTGFHKPFELDMKVGNKLASLQPHEFWELVDKGLLKRIDEPEDA